MNDSNDVNVAELFKYWDYKLTLFVAVVVVFVTWYVMSEEIYLDDESVYSREGVIYEVVSCEGGLNSKKVVVKDYDGNIMVWARNNCDDVRKDLLESSYRAFFSKKRNSESPIYLEMDGNVYFEPGLQENEFGAIVLLSGFLSFFGSIFVLKNRRKKAIEKRKK